MTNPDDEPITEEEAAAAKVFFAAARSFLRFCRLHGMGPSETCACLSTAIGMAMFASGNPWTKEAGEAFCLVVEKEIQVLEEEGARRE
jgi:hypothetical protein